MDNSEDIDFKKLFVPFTNVKAFIFIAIIGLVVFFNSLTVGFVWDDKPFIQFNPYINNLSPSNIFGQSLFNNVNAGHYRAFVALYFGVVHTIFGNNVVGYHVLEVTAHIVNTFLVFLLLKKFIRKEIAYVLSLFFLVHPIQVEAVTYIGSSDNQLFFLFGMTALLLSFKKNITLLRSVIIFLLLFCCLMTKETALLFVLLVLGYNFLFLKRNMLLHSVFAVVIGLVYLYMRIGVAGVLHSHITLAPITRLTFLERMLNIPSVVFYYIKTVIFPKDLAMEQVWVVKNLEVGNFFIPLAALVAVVAALVYLGFYFSKKNKKSLYLYLFFASWLVVGMGLYSQIIPLEMTVSERWFYFPFVGFLGIIGLFANNFYSLFLKNKTIVVGCIAVVLLILSARTIVRNSNWQTPISIYSHDLTVLPNYDLENSLGGELNALGRREEAFVHFKKSVALFPHETNLFNLGLSYENKKDFKNAEKYYTLALNSKSYGEVTTPHRRHNVTYERLAIMKMKHDVPGALDVLNKGIKDYPDNILLWYIKAFCEYEAGNKDKALDAVSTAQKLMPGSAQLKTLYEKMKNGEEVKMN